MLNAIRQFDMLVRKTLTAFCGIFLFLMVAFAVYNVVMRYVFEDPPVWGDLLTPTDRAVIANGRYGQRRGFGTNPMFVMIDCPT